jgi:hypothetical protein
MKIIIFLINSKAHRVLSFIAGARACTVNHYGFVIYRFYSKLMCLLEPVEVTDNSYETPAYFAICIS